VCLGSAERGSGLSDLATVRVDLGARAYDVVIGPGAAGRVCREAASLARVGKIALLADPKAGAAFGERVGRDLSGPAEVHSCSLPPGEAAKKLETVEEICRRLVQLEFERDDLLVGLGGGAATDVTGFVAAVFLRGVRFVSLPTTLLGQVDAAVGGKTGVNLPEGKNLVGAFHQPVLVGCDTEFLATLPEREFRAGLGEVVKTAWLGDADLFRELEQNPPRGPDHAQLPEIVRRCVAVKADIVGCDEREKGMRERLNFGHTFGHAIETTARGRWLHGEAVALGLVAAVHASVTTGRCEEAELARLVSLLDRLGLPAADRRLEPESVFVQIRHDKKRREGKDRYQLTHGVGSVSVAADLPEEAARAALEFLRR
jgi:3-dehydroquinate synthase